LGAGGFRNACQMTGQLGLGLTCHLAVLTVTIRCSTHLQMLQLAHPHSSSTGLSTFVFQLAQFAAFVSPCLIQIWSLYSQHACPGLIGFKTAIMCHWPPLPYLPPVFTPSCLRLEDFVRR